MSTEEIRIACLKLAVEAQAADPVEEAKRMADFVQGKTASGSDRRD